MAETLYNVTVANTSPTIAYTPYVTNNAISGGWQSSCPTYVTSPSGQNSWMCDPESAHTTSSYKAGFQLSFDGVGIYLFGNTTNSLNFDITLDGVHLPGNPRLDQGLLFSAVGLEPGAHTISLTVRQPPVPSDPGSVTFKEAVVSAGTGLTGATVSTQVIDDGDRTITYYAPPNGNWTIENVYTQAISADGSTTFHDSYWTDATATIAFQGNGIAVYGACYSHSRFAAYAASMDGSAETSYDGTVNLYSEGGLVKQRAGNCLRYFKTGLDGSKNHQLVLRVKEAGRLAVDWAEIFTASGGAAADNSQGGGGGGGGNGGGASSVVQNSKVPIIAGAIAGGVVLALALLTLYICFYRRKHHGAQEIFTPAPLNPMLQTGYATTPFDASNVPITPPWPQPQTPAPSGIHTNTIYAPVALQARHSYASSGAPLISPALHSASSYPAAGSGWPDSATYRTSSYTSGPPSATRRPSVPGSVVTSVAPSSSPGGEPGPSVAANGLAPLAGGYFNYGDARMVLASPAPSAPPTYDQVQPTHSEPVIGTRKGR